MTRNGKIARLPREIRAELNRRLDDGEPQTNLVDWLNSFPEAQAVLQAEFAGRPINEQNLTEWKQGGYREWQRQQQALEMVRHMDADADELNQASKKPLSDLMANRVQALYILVLQLLSEENASGEIDRKQLRELCADIVALRKGDHSAERLKLERERLEFDQHRAAEDLLALAESDTVQDIVGANDLTPEKIAKLQRILFGERPSLRPIRPINEQPNGN